MNMNKIIDNKFKVIAIAIPILIILLPLCYSIASYIFVEDDQTPQLFLELPDERYKECVKDTEYMRHHHWELLRGIREEIVRYGVRSEINLNKCRECHSSRENFCNKCHDAVSLTPDCFGCHYYP